MLDLIAEFVGIFFGGGRSSDETAEQVENEKAYLTGD